MNTKELIDRIFKEPGVKFELTEFENLGKPIHEIISIYPKAATTGKDVGKTKFYLKSFIPFSTGNEEVQVYAEGGKSAPEEIVRQLWVYKLMQQYGYKADEIDLEKSVQFGTEVGTKAADIIVYTDATKVTPKIIVECKKPKRVLPELAKRLSAEFGKGFALANLRNFRQFFLNFSWEEIRYTACSELSWSHYRCLMRVENKTARSWYANEAATQNWSVRALDRQISTLYYERLLGSPKQDGVREEAANKIAAEAPTDPRDFIRDPYVLEFLGVQPGAGLYEQDIEQGLIDRLQQFLMELGRGFAFVARQKRLQVEGDDFFVDLVFYNYLLKCFVLIDLKVGKLAHQDVGQLDMYVRVFDEQQRGEGDNPTIGLILCSERNAAVAKYSALADKPQLFASKYQTFLPSEEELRAELERDRALLESAREALDD